MANFFANNKSTKVNYIAPSTWRKVFLTVRNDLFRSREKFIHDRSSTVTAAFLGSKVRIYNGKRYHMRLVTRWMLGYKFGEFSWTRKLALYKAKQLKKKKK